MIPYAEIRHRVLFMLEHESGGSLACCAMATVIGCTTHDVIQVCCQLESEGVLARGLADGNKLAFRTIFI